MCNPIKALNFNLPVTAMLTNIVLLSITAMADNIIRDVNVAEERIERFRNTIIENAAEITG